MSTVNNICTGTFGEEVIFRGDGTQDARVQAIYDDNYVAVDPETNAPVSSNHLMLGFKTSDLPRRPVKGDLFNVRGTDHKVIDVQQDSEGMVKVILHLSTPRRRRGA